MMNYQRKRNMYMYLFGGKRWVDNNLALVLFKHHCHNMFLHKVTYMSKRYVSYIMIFPNKAKHN